MIRRLLRRMFGIEEPGLRRIPRSEHGLAREAISPAARKVCEVLAAHGHAAHVVGGAVRDLLLGLAPKDFDVATDARPERVKALFRRAYIVGRRFRLVHVVIGGETVEVSTFRAFDPETVERDEHGRVLRDNVYGTQEEDARRRDFTVNALFYDPATETVLDWHEGLADLRKRRLRIIGDPETRYREDPVRMLRAVRLAGKLGFTIDPQTRTPIRRFAALVERVPPARLFDEMLKLLLSGHASACLRQLRDEGLHRGLLPLLDVILDQPLGERFVTLALAQTDERVRSGRPVSPAFLFAALLWHQVLAAWRAHERAGERPVPALAAAIGQVLQAQCEKLAIQRRYTTLMREIWAMQPRFEQRSGQRPFRLLAAPHFRMGYDFLALRAASGEVPAELEAWWRTFQAADDDTRRAMRVAEAAPAPRRRRRRRRKAAVATAPTP